MTNKEAVQALIDGAGRWAENAEENYSRRIKADDTNDVLATLCENEYEMSDAVEIRDIWKAIEILSKEFELEAAPR